MDAFAFVKKGMAVGQVLLFLLMFLIVVAIVPLKAGANGMTTHVVIGEKAILGLSNSDLAALLTNNRNAFRSGSIFPDMALGYFQGLGGGWKSDSDGLSHGPMNGTLGIVNEYLLDLQNACPSLTGSPECEEATAFFFGMLNHLVADAPSHATFIYQTLRDNCMPGITDNEYWHKFADGDIDVCLAKELNNFPAYSYFRNTPSLTGEFGVSIFTLPTSQAELAAKCPAASELSTLGCYSCPSGYTYDDNGPDGGCYKDVTTTTSMVKSSSSVPKQYYYVFELQWYGCPGGYSHNGLIPFNLKGICTKTTRSRADATFQKFPNQGLPICDSGQVLAGGCYSCTGGYSYPDELIAAGVIDPTQTACYNVITDVVNCDLIKNAELPSVPRTFNEYFEMNPYVTSYIGTQNANTASFPANSTAGYATAHSAYTAMGKGAAFPSSTALRSSANTVLNDQFKKEHVIPLTPKQSSDPDAPFTANAKNCDWGYEHLTDAAGGITDQASMVAEFLDAVWSGLQNGSRVGSDQSPLAVWRTGSFNYGVFVDGVPTDCIYGSGCSNSEVQYKQAGPGEVVSTATGSATAGDLVDTTVTTPNAGFVSLFEQSSQSSGADVNVKVLAPNASAAAPLSLEFLFRIFGGAPSISIYRSGSLVADCDDASGTAAPDPCVAGVTSDGDGVHITVLSSTDGNFTFKDSSGALLQDSDGDGVLDGSDNCPAAANADQTDTDTDGAGNACDTDDDDDLVDDVSDNCPLVANAGQANNDLDGLGDVCDLDDDNDSMPDDWEIRYGLDPLVAADPQQDTDDDGVTDLQEYQLGLDPQVPDNPLPAPRLLSPGNGAVDVSSPVRFIWKRMTASNSAVNYDLFVCKDDSDFAGACDSPVNTAPLVASAAVPGTVGPLGTGAGLLVLGLVFAGGKRGRRMLVLLLIVTVLGGSLLLACSRDHGDPDISVYAVAGLETASTYYWKVTVSDRSRGLSSESVVWSFTTPQTADQ